MNYTEDQPKTKGYCECGATCFELDGRFTWATDLCPYNDDGRHRIENVLWIPTPIKGEF